MRYYIEDKSQPNGFIEVTETAYKALFGDDTIGQYVRAVYSGDMVIDDVSIEHREAVQTVVSNRVNRWGLYQKTEDYPEIYGGDS